MKMNRVRFCIAGAFLLTALAALVVPASAQSSRRARPNPAEVAGEAANTAAGEAVKAAGAPGVIGFHGTKAGGGHLGSFKSWKFTKVDIPGGDITKGTVEIEIDIASLESDNERVTGHLKTNDFFGATEFPKATVVISNAKPTEQVDGKQAYEADAKLTLRGVTQPLKVKFAVQNEKPLTIKGTATVDRPTFKFGADYDAKNPGRINPAVDITVETVVPEKIDAAAKAADASTKVSDAASKAIDDAAAKAKEAVK